METNLMAQLTLILPELLLALGALVLLMIGVFTGGRAYSLVNSLAVLLLIVAGMLVIFLNQSGVVFNNALIIDHFSSFMKVLIVISAIIAVILSFGYARAEKFDHFEFAILIILSTIGMTLMVSAGNTLSLYLSFELQSLALYILAAFNRNNLRSSEAGLKYFVLGALSSGLLLYGISLVYGYTGQIGFREISDVLSGQPPQLAVIFGIVFILAGISFKISIVPFHMWTPDVYEGAPTPVTMFFATAPKIAAMALIVRVVVEAFSPLSTVNGAMPAWQQIIIFMSLASMILAAFAAIGQSNIKRLMAYSSIGHMGYALVGLAAGNSAGVAGVIIYMTIYLAMTAGCFSFILGMRTRDGNVENIYDLAGLGRTNPYMAAIMIIMLFSLAGIPPLAGFFSKWYTFSAAVQAGLVPLAVIGMVASVVSAFYYLRVIKIIYFDDVKSQFQPLALELKVILGLSGLFVVFYVVFGGWVYNLAQIAAHSLFL